ncbi:MAG: SRPBCC family protein [Frankia sp.]|nr:SRPBCC family protein [Frankia sp.]
MAESSNRPNTDGLFGAVRNNPATDRLMREMKGFAAAQGQKAIRQVGEHLGSAGGPLGEGARKLAEGQSPAKAAMSTGMSALKQKLSAAVGMGGGVGGGAGGSSEPGPPKVTHIAETIDVAVPVSTAYDQWTQFQDFPSFMKGVEGVDLKSETEQTWRVKVFKSRRNWKGKTLEQIPDRRIVWTTEGEKGTTKGAVTFHPLADDLTRVTLTMEYYPSGFMEKTGNIWRAGGRRARLDLKHFRRFVTLKGEATGSWRGEIRDGEVVRQPGEEEPQTGEQEPGQPQASPDEPGRQPRAEEAAPEAQDEEESREAGRPEPAHAGAGSGGR